MTLTDLAHWFFVLAGWTAGGLLAVLVAWIVAGRRAEPVRKPPKWALERRVIDLREPKPTRTSVRR